MAIEAADLLQGGGLATFAGVVWYELRTGLGKVTSSIDRLSKGFSEGMKDIRKDMAQQREDLARDMTTTHERLNTIAKLSSDAATRATAKPVPIQNRLPLRPTSEIPEEVTGG